MATPLDYDADGTNRRFSMYLLAAMIDSASQAFGAVQRALHGIALWIEPEIDEG